MYIADEFQQRAHSMVSQPRQSTVLQQGPMKMASASSSIKSSVTAAAGTIQCLVSLLAQCQDSICLLFLSCRGIEKFHTVG